MAPGFFGSHDWPLLAVSVGIWTQSRLSAHSRAFPSLSRTGVLSGALPNKTCSCSKSHHCDRGSSRGTSRAFPWEGAYHVGGRDVNLSEAEWAALFSGGTHPPSPPISFDSLGTISIWICLWSFSCPFRDGLTDEDAPSWLSVLKMFWVVMAS